MNAEDQAYYAGMEFKKRLAEFTARLDELWAKGVREPLRAGAGSVAVNHFGVVVDVQIDKANSEYIAESALGKYLAEAIGRAEAKARQTYQKTMNSAFDMEVTG